MDKEILIEHYNNKYAHEKNNEALDLIPYKKHPIHRSEAAVKYFIDNFKGGSILELGAGNGDVAYSILKQANNIERYVISDLSENRLEGVKNSINDERFEIQKIDVEHFDYTNIKKVDAVIMIALIEHLIDPIGTLKKIKQVLKPNGFVYIDTANVADYGARFKMLTGRFPSTASKNDGNLSYDNKPVTLFDEGHFHYFTYKSLSDMLINYCGFIKTEKYYQMVGRRFLGDRIHHELAKLWPEMFSNLILIAK